MDGVNRNFLAKLLLGGGMAKNAANDLELRNRWLKLQEQHAMGEIDQLPDYESWRKMQLRPNG